MTGNVLQSVVVVGAGLAAWTAAAVAATLGAKIVVASVPDPAPAVLDLFGIADPAVRDMHADLHLSELQFIREAAASFRLGSLIKDTGRPNPFFHGCGTHGVSHASVPFHQLWIRCGARAAFHQYSATSVAAIAGRFAHSAVGLPPFLQTEYGFHYNPVRYAQLMRRIAGAKGVTERAPCVAALRSGLKTALHLGDGSVLHPDLIIDTTADGRIARAMTDRLSWREQLPCDRILHATREHAGPIALHDTLSATSEGWQLELPGPDVTTHVRISSSAHVSDERSRRNFRVKTGREAQDIPLRYSSGRLRAAWVGNVVAVGEAAVTIDPVDGIPLQLLHSQLQRILALLPDRDMQPVELLEYNRQFEQEADRARDFLQTRYRLATRREPFWRDAAALEPSETLAYDLRLFAERGRLISHDYDAFSRDSWLAVLLGYGLRPRRTDALAAEIDSSAASTVLDRLRRQVEARVATLPHYRDYLDHVRMAGAQK